MGKRILLICSLALSVFLSACQSNKMIPASQTGFYFDTVISITIYDSTNKALIDSCFELADYYEKIFSRTIDGSDIYRINHSGGKPTVVSSKTIDLLSTAIKYSILTDGIVDPSIGGVSSLWDFHDSGVLPDESDIKAAICHVNYENIIITGNTVTLTDPDTDIDLGFIAKGYIADKIKEYLILEGVNSAIINLGGNVLTIGSKPDGSPFTIGIQEPFADTGTAATVVSVNDKSVVTSGIYERYFTYNGSIYHHILDTDTGYPVCTDLLGVTIISDSSTDGDALSTACLALGYEKAVELINSFENTDAVFITSDGEIHTTY